MEEVWWTLSRLKRIFRPNMWYCHMEVEEVWWTLSRLKLSTFPIEEVT